MRFAFYLACLFAWAPFATNAAAQRQCRPVDLRRALGAVRNQGDSSWCYAHTSADLISLKLGVRVSSFDLATTFQLADEAKLAHGKSPEIAEYLTLHPEFSYQVNLERTRERGVFSSSQILGEQGLYAAGGVEDLTILLSNVAGLCSSTKLPDENEDETLYAADLAAVVQTYKKMPADEKSYLENELRRLKYITSAKARAKAGALQSWVNARCQTRIVSPTPLIPSQYSIAATPDDLDKLDPEVRKERQAILRVVIDAVLDQHHAVAIGSDAYDLVERSSDQAERHADHSAVIAARKNTRSGCRYFIRQSFGDSCDLILKKYRRSCEHGGVWVTLEEIPTLYSAIWIE